MYAYTQFNETKLYMYDTHSVTEWDNEHGE